METFTAKDRDVFMLALCAYAEASDQGQVGIRAQIHSVINRHQMRAWYSGKTIASTIMQPYAYSAMNSKDTNRIRALECDMEEFTWQLCVAEAQEAIDGASDDPTNGATHYYKQGTPTPNWVTGVRDGRQVAAPAIFTGQIKDHRFYKGVR